MAAPSKYTARLKDNRILCLGGTSGMGFCIAEGALEQGASVVVASSRQEKVDKAIERLKEGNPSAADRVEGYVIDLADRDNIESNVEKLLISATAKGKLNHITFTAGEALQFCPITEVTVDYAEHAVFTRFIGTTMLAKFAHKYMVLSTESSFSLTGGTIGKKPPPGGSTILCAFTNAMEGLTRGLAVELKPIRVNQVNPGLVQTEAFDNYPQSVKEMFFDGYKKTNLTGTVGDPSRLAEAYLYLMKDNFVTGTTIESNGGTLLG